MNSPDKLYSPVAGHFLHASCSDESVYEILGGTDSTIDVKVLLVNEVLRFAHDDDAKGDGSDNKWFNPLTHAELPEGVHLIFRDMQYRLTSPGYRDVVRMVVNAPGGCYRCCSLFGVYLDRDGRIPVVL